MHDVTYRAYTMNLHKCIDLHWLTLESYCFRSCFKNLFFEQRHNWSVLLDIYCTHIFLLASYKRNIYHQYLYQMAIEKMKLYSNWLSYYMLLIQAVSSPFCFISIINLLALFCISQRSHIMRDKYESWCFFFFFLPFTVRS